MDWQGLEWIGGRVGFASLPMAGGPLIAPSSSDDATASTPPDSSMKVQSAAPVEHSTSDVAAASNPVAADAQSAVPGTATAAAVPGPVIPPVTSPTTPALAAVAPIHPSPVGPPNLGQASLPAAVV